MSWLIYGVALSGLLTLAAWGLEKGLAALGRPTRWVWAFALAASVIGVGLAAVGVLPLALSGDPGPGTLTFEVSHRDSATLPPSAEATIRSLTADVLYSVPVALAWAVNGADGTLQRALDVMVPSDGIPPLVLRVLMGLWVAVSLALLATVARAHRRLVHGLARWPATGILGYRVRLSGDVGPAVVGILRPEVVVPSRLLGLDRREMGLILLHEEEHRRVGDTRLLAVCLLPLVLVPWNPFLWVQYGRLRQAMESDCDARVLRHGVSPRAYASTLLSIGVGRSSGPVPSLALSAPARHLRRRIRAMKPRSLRHRIPSALAGGGLAALVLVAACQVDVPTADTSVPPEAESASEAQEAVVEITPPVEEAPANPPLRTGDVMLRAGAADPDGPSPLFVLDGEVWSEDLSELDPNDIARIEILKGEAALTHWGEAGAHGVIRIFTKERESVPGARGTDPDADGHIHP